MIVAHVVPALFGPDGVIGGAERYAFELARHMAREVSTTLVTFGPQDRDDRVGPLRLRVLGRPWHVRGQWSNPFSLRIFGALREADVVHCHQQHVLTTSLVALWCRLTGRRAFVTDLGGGGWDLSAYLSTDAWFDGHLHLSNYSVIVSQQASVTSDERPASTRVRVIAGGVDLEKFSPDSSVSRTGAVLFVGRLLPHKGVDELIRGLPPEMALTVIGPAPDPGYAAQLRRLAEGKRVTFRDAVTDDELVLAYRQALCVVLPSVYRASDGSQTRVPELLGQTLIESMACATPTVCTDVASLPEVVADGVTGFVVPPNDHEALGHALRRLHDDPVRAADMGRAGRARVLERFTWPQVVGRCLGAYAVADSGVGVVRRRVIAFLRLTATVLLLAGFARASGTVVRHFVSARPDQVATSALRGGRQASSDLMFRLSGHGSPEGFLRAVQAAGLPEDATITFVTDEATVPSRRFWQSYYMVSYLLYPRRVVPQSWCQTNPACAASSSGQPAFDPASAGFVMSLLPATHEGPQGDRDPGRGVAAVAVAPGLTLAPQPTEWATSMTGR